MSVVSLVELGTVRRSYLVTEDVGRLRTRFVERPSGHVDWTLDGVPLRQLVVGPDVEPDDGVTPVGNANAGRGLAYGYLRTLLGRPATDAWTMPDGRVALLCCAVDFDLGCGTLTADLGWTDEHVMWRDVGFQTSDAALDLAGQDGPIRSFRFDRNLYDEVLQHLLTVETTNLR